MLSKKKKGDTDMAGTRGEPERLSVYVDSETVRRVNYVVEVLRLTKEYGKPGTIFEIDVEHQDSCSIWNGSSCDCRPRVFPAGKPEYAVRRAFRK